MTSHFIGLHILLFLAIRAQGSRNSTYVSNIEVSTLAGSGNLGADGQGKSAGFNYPYGNCVDYTGTYVYVNDYNIIASVRRIVISTGEVSTILSGQSWKLASNIGLTCDESGGIFTSSGAIFYASLSAIEAVGSVATIVAGNVDEVGSTDSAVGISALFNKPYFINLDPGYSFLYIADFSNSLIRKMSTASPYAVTTIASLSSVLSVVVDSTYIFAISRSTAIYRELLSSCIGQSFIVSTVYAGTLSSAGYHDGSLQSATFEYLNSLAIDSDSNLYVTDNYAVRFITTSSVSTIAGSVDVSGYRDGNGSYSYFTTSFVGVSSRNASYIFISDFDNAVIRNISCTSGYTLTLGSCGKLRTCHVILTMIMMM